MPKPVGDPQPRPLDDTQRRLEAVLDNATVAIILMDHRQQCVYMNKAAEVLTGYRLQEVLELDRPLHDIIHHTYPDGRPFPLHECAIDRAFPEHNQTQGEEVFVHRDGSFYPVGFTASPVRDEASNTVGTIIEVRNIRADKQAQERQRLLMNELNHRVKNTLATVQSIAWQTFRQTEPESLNLFQGRLGTLARAHNLLTETAWESASLAAVIDLAIDPFDSQRVLLRGPDCAVSPKVAVSLSMVLHELGTNALKYGALSGANGCVELRWALGAAGELTINWQELNGPPVVQPVRRGFGTRLIERQLAMEFGGTVELQFPPEGLNCRMQLRLPQNVPDMSLPDPQGQ
ncbi:PAS domain S-box protein [Halopseudomonas nanhaiensis]|uniref:sensor histidine kinase n=1 Tax=Halopseudomonas nanhaiensis TaxID=2830842 RepID=UPI001CC1BD62|nr:HWE histidine kinase domain-containing protein [Halopseudomonas nanhaiensis]UAW97553.1 PAS domain S-box protein [Halopseudomonas nanhaiensis]